MSYNVKYRFRFEATNGDTYTIDVSKENYSGDIIQRPLGRAPVLKRERNGHICGGSLEFYPECHIDQEFAEFYTSDPLMFKVHLEVSSPDGESYSGSLFDGFISPEIYAEPDIAPPYDVQVIATDGLGETKRYMFGLSGLQSFYDILQEILDKTGNVTTIWHNNRTLDAGGFAAVPEAQFFGYAKIDTDFLSGLTCYDALEKLLDSIDADMFYWSGHWQIMRVTEIEAGASITVNTSPYGSEYDNMTPAVGFGSMQSYGLWPVGQMETTIKPACKRLLVKTDALYKDGFINPYIDSATGWTLVNASYDSNLDAIKITSQSGSISQTVSFETSVRIPLKLSIAVRQYRGTHSDPSAAGTVGLRVVKRNSSTGTTYSGYLAKNTLGEYYWSQNDTTISFDIPEPVFQGTVDDCTVIDIELPIRFTSQTSPADSIEVKIIRNSSNIPLLVHSASLRVANEIAGYKDIFSIDNGAREDADDVDTLFIPSLTGHYNTPVEFMQNVIYGYGGSQIDLFTQVGADYAKECALPRLLKRGILNIPPEMTVMPIVFRDSSGNNYIVQSFDWDLYNSEMTVEILSLPAVSVTISEQKISEMVYQGGTTSSSGSSSGGGGGGGGGGGTVTSVGLEMPSAFVVTQTPVTSSGTIRVQMSDGYAVPTTAKQSQWDQAYSAKHSHSNKSVLDGITSAKVTAWDGAASASHSHANMGILNAIDGDMMDFLSQNATQILHVAPSVKRLKLQANTTSQGGSAPCFIVRHPLLELGISGVQICLMVYRKRNGQGGTRKAHRKGWFLACGDGHAANAAYVADTYANHGTIIVPQIDLLDGIARTYCKILEAAPNEDYADWLYWMTQVSSDFTQFGFAGTDLATNFKRKIHLGLAIRVVNPDFTNLVDPNLGELSPDTGSIEGVPRYLYSNVAPLTAYMYDRATSGQPRGGVVLSLLP